ncbi:hypothetical protein BST81_25535 [Leptolyngbya sp. 'hensonii']|uniref:hypothetical protein n=1 Tax=Leptolyngbya sp. 'hensonii' TaxID=1922337 RepID=UPI00094FC109|nr:hypothetical protein [Leptolyngbya sp. 'hensonii']OLP15573.1 hypothetical protein BST81_25535 [Leptolyngbya sp. 'hensonii']
MTELLKSSLRDSTTDLLTHYGFDLNGYTATQLISQWTNLYQSHWIRQAVIEALYQGRYKAISVEQILATWWRRGQPICHFSREFERIICSTSSQVDWGKGEQDVNGGLPPEQAGDAPGMETCAEEASIDGMDAKTEPEMQPLPDSQMQNMPEGHPEQRIHLPDWGTSLAQRNQEQSQSESLNLNALQSEEQQPLETRKPPIHQFIPLTETSEFYSKLRAVAQTVRAGEE